MRAHTPRSAQVYTFWNVHEPQPGVYDFSGRLDIVTFLQQAQAAGLYVTLRVGPYVCAEWNYGGLPVWLRDVPGMVFRDDNAPWKAAMQNWTTYIVTKLADANLFASQGGPIILAQIENEYGNIESSYPNGPAYVAWAAEMAQNLTDSLGVAVPWIMCVQPNAPSNVVSTCNGFYCDNWIEGHWKERPNEPAVWTENWPGWFQHWGEGRPHRPAEDVAFAVARWVARGGSLMNYYMYHGGTNFARTVGGPSITTTYDYDVALDEYGLISEPKYSHLGDLHHVIHKHADLLLQMMPPTAQPICPSAAASSGCQAEAHVYTNSGGGCVAFLSNIGNTDQTVQFRGVDMTLPGWSVTILEECKSPVYSTADVTVRASSKTAVAAVADSSRGQRRLDVPVNDDEIPSSSFTALQFAEEPVGVWDTKNASGGVFDALTPLEQIHTTRDTSDYLWYTATVHTAMEEGATLELSVADPRDVVHVFTDDRVLLGSLSSLTTTVAVPVGQDGVVSVNLLAVSMGLANFGTHMELVHKGVEGTVKLASQNITSVGWTHQVGLEGESLQRWVANSTAQWGDGWSGSTGKPLVWLKASFASPSGTDPLVIDMSSMGKGNLWVNGHHLGRYWLIDAISSLGGNVCGPCDYRGPYEPAKCRTDCGGKSQKLYHVPADWLAGSGGSNTLVIFEETAVNTSGIAVKTVMPDIVCSDIGEQWPQGGTFVSVECQSGQVVTDVVFASFGTPTGSCGTYEAGPSCHASNSTTVVEKLCLGKQSCVIPVLDSTFGDPCPNQTKALAVEAKCGTSQDSVYGSVARH